MQIRKPVILMGALTLCALPGVALQEFYGAGPMPVGGGWPSRTADLINHGARFAGTVGFADTWAHYAGDTDALNGFLARYAELTDTRLTVVLHPGPRPIDMNRHDGTQRAVNADWTLHIAEHYEGRTDSDLFEGHRCLATVDVYLGRGIDLAELKVPANIALQSGGEIEAFVKAHESR
ncbi:MAG: hypothetical protein AMXMBFR82_04080 [Candidatus Hydrogenedentota bacterium]